MNGSFVWRGQGFIHPSAFILLPSAFCILTLHAVPRARYSLDSIQLHPPAKSFVVPVKVLERGLGVMPAVITASGVEVDEPETLHVDPQADDGCGPLADDELIVVDRI